MKYQDWLNEVPNDFLNDAVWNLKVYRAALFLTDLCWLDTQPIIENRFFSLADQLYDSTGSISANITEGYSRNSNKEKARFMK